jgi:hypothetical protein
MRQGLESVLKMLEPFALGFCSDSEWSDVVAECEYVGGVSGVSVSAQRILAKAEFGSRSEAGRYAALQRWKTHIPVDDVITAYPNAKPAVAVGEPFPPPPTPDTEPDPKYGEESIRLARELRAKSVLLEPEVTNMILAVAQKTGAETPDLKHRLKATGSLARKIHNEGMAEHDGDFVKSAEGISDAIRYTMVIDDDNYLGAAQQIIKDFESSGYKIRNKNFWQTGDPFDAMTLKLSKDGVTTELQMLTPAAKKAKELNHPLYEIYRDPSTPMLTRMSAWKKMVDVAKLTPRPLGYSVLLTLGTLVLQKPDWALM